MGDHRRSRTRRLLVTALIVLLEDVMALGRPAHTVLCRLGSVQRALALLHSRLFRVLLRLLLLELLICGRLGYHVGQELEIIDP